MSVSALLLGLVHCDEIGIVLRKGDTVFQVVEVDLTKYATVEIAVAIAQGVDDEVVVEYMPGQQTSILLVLQLHQPIVDVCRPGNEEIS